MTPTQSHIPMPVGGAVDENTTTYPQDTVAAQLNIRAWGKSEALSGAWSLPQGFERLLGIGDVHEASMRP
jgi:hypothetical protein